MRMKASTVTLMFSISLKARILREFQKVTRVQEQEFSERELFALELISDFGPITERGLGKVFGLSPSSVSDMLQHLCELGLIDIKDKARGKPLILSKLGEERLRSIKQISATRFGYLFERLEDDDWAALDRIFTQVDKNAERYVNMLVFDRAPSDALGAPVD